MAEFVKITDFLNSKKDEIAAPCGIGDFYNLLKVDGHELAAGAFDFLAGAIVDIADGAKCAEWHKITPHLEVFLTIKKRG